MRTPAVMLFSSERSHLVIVLAELDKNTKKGTEHPEKAKGKEQADKGKGTAPKGSHADEAREPAEQGRTKSPGKSPGRNPLNKQ